MGTPSQLIPTALIRKWLSSFAPPIHKHDYRYRIQVDVGEHIMFHCINLHYFEHDRSNTSFKVPCNENASYVFPDVWPVCLSNINCTLPQTNNDTTFTSSFVSDREFEDDFR